MNAEFTRSFIADYLRLLEDHGRSLEGHFVELVLEDLELLGPSKQAEGFLGVLLYVDGDVVVRAERGAAVLVHVAFVGDGEVGAVGRAVDRAPAAVSGDGVLELVLLDGEDHVAIEGEEEGSGGGIADVLLLLGVEPLGWRVAAEDLALVGFGDHQGRGAAHAGVLEERALEVVLAGPEEQPGRDQPLVDLREHDSYLFDFVLAEGRRHFLEDVGHVEFSARGGPPIFDILLDNTRIPLQKGKARGTHGVEVQHWLVRSDQLLQLPDAVIADASHIVIQNRKLAHPP